MAGDGIDDDDPDSLGGLFSIEWPGVIPVRAKTASKQLDIGDKPVIRKANESLAPGVRFLVGNGVL